MPSRKDHTAAPGSYSSNGVRCTMDPPFKSGLNKGAQGDSRAPFDKGRSGGDNGLPTHVIESLGSKTKTPKAGFASASPSKDLT